MTLNHSTQSGRHALGERGADLYETPAVAVEALLRVELPPLWVWEPAAGHGAIARVLRDHGHVVIANDLINYGNLDFVRDFLAEPKMLAGCEAICTNRRTGRATNSCGTRSIWRRKSICYCGWPF